MLPRFSSCHSNQTLYKVLKLENLMDLNTLRTYIDGFKIKETINELQKKIRVSSNVTIFPDKAKMKLENLKDSGLGEIKFDQYINNLKDNFTNFNLKDLANKLNSVATQLPAGNERNTLTKNANLLLKSHSDHVVPMTKLSDELSENAMKLEEHVKFNHSSMGEAIRHLVSDVTLAQQFLNEEGPKCVQRVSFAFFLFSLVLHFHRTRFSCFIRESIVLFCTLF